MRSEQHFKDRLANSVNVLVLLEVSLAVWVYMPFKDGGKLSCTLHVDCTQSLIVIACDEQVGTSEAVITRADPRDEVRVSQKNPPHPRGTQQSPDTWAQSKLQQLGGATPAGKWQLHPIDVQYQPGEEAILEHYAPLH